VMTDVRATSVGLIIDRGVSGRLFVRDARGNLVVELNRPEGHITEIGLGPGAYTITRETEQQTTLARVELTEGRRSLLSDLDFVPVGVEPTVVRGPPSPPSSISAPVEIEKRDEPEAPPAPRSFYSAEFGFGSAVADHMQPLIEARFGRDPAQRWGWVVALKLGDRDGYNSRGERFNELHVGLRGGWVVLFPVWRLTFGLGIEGGAFDIYQSGAGNIISLELAGRGLIRFRLSEHIYLTADADVALQPITLNHSFGFIVAPTLVFGLGVTL
jgi:hypothetical protein